MWRNGWSSVLGAAFLAAASAPSLAQPSGITGMATSVAVAVTAPTVERLVSGVSGSPGLADARGPGVAYTADSEVLVASNASVRVVAPPPALAVAARAPALVVYAAFYLPYEVRELPKVERPTTSGETVNAWTSAVFLGSPTASRTPIDQWVAAAYFLGARRR